MIAGEFVHQPRFAMMWGSIGEITHLGPQLAARCGDDVVRDFLAEGSARGLRAVARAGRVVLVLPARTDGTSGLRGHAAVITMDRLGERWPDAAAAVPRGSSLYFVAVLRNTWQVRPVLFEAQLRLGAPHAYGPLSRQQRVARDAPRQTTPRSQGNSAHAAMCGNLRHK